MPRTESSPPSLRHRPRNELSAASGKVEKIRIGWSTLGCEIESVVFNGDEETILIIGGLHGDEPKGVYVARRLIEHLTTCQPLRSVIVVPVANPDGYNRRSRRNASGVDLNRNFPTNDWTPAPKSGRYYSGPSPASEPETQALIAVIESRRPAVIVAIHSINRLRHCNNYDGPARKIAEAMSRRNKYPVQASIGYPTPGSLGTWAGIELGIPIITLELPSHHSPKRCWVENLDALTDVVRT